MLLTKRWICDNNDIDNDAKVRDHGHISVRYRGSPHRDCSIDIKLIKKFLSRIMI